MFRALALARPAKSAFWITRRAVASAAWVNLKAAAHDRRSRRCGGCWCVGGRPPTPPALGSKFHPGRVQAHPLGHWDAPRPHQDCIHGQHLGLAARIAQVQHLLAFGRLHPVHPGGQAQVHPVGPHGPRPPPRPPRGPRGSSARSGRSWSPLSRSGQRPGPARSRWARCLARPGAAEVR